ncbi:MAG: hypothetical protein M0R06_22215 [Sphaerochaeta sp.]|nr:hypothetical protein [Sphaerochaeta sp.]
MAGVSAFRQAYVASGSDSDAFESAAARQVRYLLFFSFYENTAYAEINKLAASLKADQHLYRYIRGIYNPTYRIAEFHKAHILGGSLNIEDPTQGAIPIQADDNLTRVIAQLWVDSGMQALKDVIALRGAIEGDVFLVVSDDLTRGKVTIQRLDARTVADVSFDGAGNVKGYVIEEKRRLDGREVQYKLIVSRSGRDVVYETFLNNAPYGWYGQPSRWSEPYGFVPMVHIKHNDVGLNFGWSEVHPIRPKFQEVDEQASMLGDYLRKYSDPVWLVSGAKKMGNVVVDDGDATELDPQPGRNKLRFLAGYAEGTKAQALLPTQDVEGTLKHIDGLQRELEKDYPELQTDIWATGDTSGRALRVARERVADKVIQRRANYDDGIVRIQKMAVSIGGMRGYFPGFSLESYGAGALEHRIADRPVFQPDPIDQGEIDAQEWEIINSAVKAGASLEGVLEMRGWPQDKIRMLLKTGDGRVQNTEGEPDGL